MSDAEAAVLLRAKDSGDVRRLRSDELREIQPWERFACRCCGRRERFDRMTERHGVLLCEECK
jgi:hypothetical protein